MNGHPAQPPQTATMRRRTGGLVPPWAATSSSLGGGAGAAAITTIHANSAMAMLVLLVLQVPAGGNLAIKWLNWRLYDHVVRHRLTRCANLSDYGQLMEDMARTQPDYLGERLTIDQTRHETHKPRPR